MELNSLDVVAASEKGIDVAIVNPKTGEATDFIITVKGMHSKQFKELMGRATQRIQKPQGGIANDKAEAAMVEVLTACTLGWKGLTENGQPVPFSAEYAANRVYANPVIRQQVFAAAVDVGNLIPD
jgi:hypothetical protein